MSKKRIASLIVGILSSITAHSATMYVSDIQFIAIREGLDNSTRAVERGLKSGTPLEVIERSGGYTKVRTPNGNEGWTASYYLSDDVVVRSQLSSLQAQVNEVTESKNDISELLQISQQELQELSNLNTSLQEENKTLKQQVEKGVELAEKAQEVMLQNKDVNYQIESLQQQASTAIAQAEELQDTTEQKWFMIGAATLFGGLLLGALAPMIRRKQNASWS